ncbi:MAG: hypothetical protein QG661_3041, partial [Actinomycetota bacterium]|nr:hypothetical protein [Actinomycetota bacterium]
GDARRAIRVACRCGRAIAVLAGRAPDRVHPLVMAVPRGIDGSRRFLIGPRPRPWHSRDILPLESQRDSTRWSERSDALWRAINEVANGYGWTLSSTSIDHNTRTFTCELVPLVRISVKREIP